MTTEQGMTSAPAEAHLSPRRAATPALPAPSEYLGPAEVVRIGASEVTVALPDGPIVPARLALAFPYRPVVGDTLLVIGRANNHYVIGVLNGKGETVLAFPENVEIRSGGDLRLTGARSVAVEGPEVRVSAGKLHVMAEAAVEKLGSLVQRVRALWTVHAGETETLVDETSLTRAKSATILTEETMSINGKQIHLG